MTLRCIEHPKNQLTDRLSGLVPPRNVRYLRGYRKGRAGDSKVNLFFGIETPSLMIPDNIKNGMDRRFTKKDLAGMVAKKDIANLEERVARSHP